MLIIQKVLRNMRQDLSKTVSTIVKTQKFVFLQRFAKNRYFHLADSLRHLHSLSVQ